MRRYAFATLLLSGVAACATPDVSAELTAARAHLTSIKTELGPDLALRAKAEYDRVQEAAIVTDAAVIGLLGDCDTIASRETPEVFSECRIVEYFDPATDPQSATEIATFLALMDSYLTSVEALVASESPQLAKAQAEAIILAFGTADENRPAAFERLGNSLRKRQTTVTATTGFVIDQVRLSALRRVLHAADGEIGKAVLLVASHLEDADLPLITAQIALVDAREAVSAAQGTRNPVAYRTAVKNLRTRHAAFIKAEAASPVVRLFQFRQSHAALLARVTTGVTPTEMVVLLEQLRALRDATQEEL